MEPGGAIQTEASTHTEEPMISEVEFVTINDVCARYSISRATFYRMLKEKGTGLRALVVRVPPPRGRIRVPVVEFEAWLKRRQAG